LEESIRRFIDREVLVLLHQNRHWSKSPLRVGEIALANNVIRIALRHAAWTDKALALAITERDGMMTASLEESGWKDELPADEKAPLARALDGLYILAGVNWIAERSMPPESIKWKDWVLAWQQDDGPNSSMFARQAPCEPETVQPSVDAFSASDVT
jgi:hypothetical protein